MLKPMARIPVRTALLVAMVLSPAVPAVAADGPNPAPTATGEVNHCRMTDICIETGETGTRPGTGGGGGGGGGGGVQLCSWNGKEWPCHDPEVGWFSNATGCYYKRLDPQPGADDPAWGGHRPTDGSVYEVNCRNTADGISAPELQFFAAAPAGPPPDDPVALARKAKGEINFPKPVPVTAPSGTLVVSVPVWLWLDQRGGPTVPAPRTVHGNTIAVTATPKLIDVVWDLDLGGGRTVTCHTPGTPYEAKYGAARSPDCGYVFTTGSATKRDGVFSGSVTVHWRIDSTVSGGSGNQPIGPLFQSATTDFQLKVAEVQVLN
ncbi:hypothetical protein ACWEQL_31045 [Kitasatospora sp. NPDC004240]